MYKKMHPKYVWIIWIIKKQIKSSQTCILAESKLSITTRNTALSVRSRTEHHGFSRLLLEL